MASNKEDNFGDSFGTHDKALADLMKSGSVKMKDKYNPAKAMTRSMHAGKIFKGYKKKGALNDDQMKARESYIAR